MKAALLRAVELAGGARLAASMTRGGLRILCYHGVTEHDEADFSPVLFMRRATFARRMEWLAGSGYRVVSLQQGLDELLAGSLPPRTVALTFDDGWAGIGQHAWPILRRLRLPFTVYVSSYYMVTGQPVFNVALRYLFWKARRAGRSLAAIGERLGGALAAAAPDEGSLATAVIAHAESLPRAERTELLRAVAESVGDDGDALIASRRFGFMSPDEVAALARDGVDIQLHTHRHRFPIGDREAALQELADNRAALAPLARAPLDHFCYPSGVYDASQFDWLRGAGVKSATTTESGLATRAAHPLALPRILDSEALPDVVFRAELSGTLALARRLAGR